jgi:photosystem II stability/assembly factor-like uncharacterized protein
MQHDLYLATSQGLVIGQRTDDRWQVVGQGLSGHSVTAVVVCADAIWAGTTDGVYRSGDDGQTWTEASTGLTLRHIRWMGCSPGSDGAVLGGTEPAGIFYRHGTAPWQTCPEVGALRDAHRWYLPYSPEAGCVRGFAFHGSHAYAAVEVGGVLRSDDGGRNWRLVEGSDGNPRVFPPAPLIHPDVHAIAVHPTSPDRVTAPTGGGLYTSVDGGKTWDNLYRCYCRAA